MHIAHLNRLIVQVHLMSYVHYKKGGPETFFFFKRTLLLSNDSCSPKNPLRLGQLDVTENYLALRELFSAIQNPKLYSI